MQLLPVISTYTVDSATSLHEYAKVHEINHGEFDGQVFYTKRSVIWMGISHAFDTLLHPGIVYMLLKSYLGAGRYLKDVISWTMIFATFCVSRSWSMLHTYHNTGKTRGWYFGYEVYHIHDLDSWMPAYVTEGIILLVLVVYKIGCEESGGSDAIFSK